MTRLVLHENLVHFDWPKFSAKRIKRISPLSLAPYWGGLSGRSLTKQGSINTAKYYFYQSQPYQPRHRERVPQMTGLDPWLHSGKCLVWVPGWQVDHYTFRLVQGESHNWLQANCPFILDWFTLPTLLLSLPISRSMLSKFWVLDLAFTTCERIFFDRICLLGLDRK